MKFKAVLFDLDGTLVDTIEDIGNAMNTVLRGLGLKPHTMAEYQYMVGWGLKDLARKSLPEEKRDDETVQKAYEDLTAEYGAHAVEKTRPYDGVTELLTELGKRGMKRAVLSNKADEITQRVVKGVFPTVSFDVVQGALPEIPMKPNPQGALRIARYIAVDPGEVLYVGDSGLDMRTACAASMFPVGVLWGYRTEFELLDGGAKTTIATPMELLELL